MVAAVSGLLAFCASGCGSPEAQSAESAPSTPASADVTSPRETAELPEITAHVSEEELSDGTRFRSHRFRLDLATTALGFLDLKFQRTLASTLDAPPPANRRPHALAFNGGFWAPSRQPEGLAQMGELEISTHDRELGGGVVVVASGRATLLDAELDDDEMLALPDDASFAIQARPRLVVDGANHIARDTGRRAHRTVLCLRDDGAVVDVYILRTDDVRGHTGPTLYQVGGWLADAGCEQALNLDGGPSTGVAWRQDGQVHALPSLSPVRLAVIARPSEAQPSEPE